MGDEANLKIEALVGCSIINDCLHGTATVHSGGLGANKADRNNIIGSGESMVAKKDLSIDEPPIQGGTLLKLPKREVGTDMNMEVDHVMSVTGGTPVGGSTDAVDILRELVTRWDVTFHHSKVT